LHIPSDSTNLAKADSEKTTKVRIKREDSNSGLACGGNKVGRLEWAFLEALAQGATKLITTGLTGELQSNQMILCIESSPI
jgi:1-aminocyclopropane-1-carboxylate deaminase